MARDLVPGLGALVLLAASLVPTAARAQALCGPGFGTTGLELCVTVESTPATVVETFTGISPLPVVTVVGDYSVNLTATVIASGGGIEVDLAGNVDKVGDTSPGSNVIVTAEGGRTGALGAGTGNLVLAGAASGAASIQLGGAAGFPFQDDLSLAGFPRICDVNLFGGGGFVCLEEAGLVNAGSVAVRNTTVVNIVDQFGAVDIPSGSGAGEPVYPMGSNREVVLCGPSVPMGVPEHFPIEQFRRAAPDLCPGDHFHMWNFTAVSLEGNSVDDNPGCGFGEVADVPLLTIGVIETDTTLSEDYEIPEGEGLFVENGATLTVAAGTVVTVSEGTKLTNLGHLVIDGEVIVTGSGILTNGVPGVIDNAADTITILGTFHNQGTVNNDGTITSLGGVVNDTGTVNGNPILAPEPGPGAGAVAALLSTLALGRGAATRRPREEPAR